MTADITTDSTDNEKKIILWTTLCLYILQQSYNGQNLQKVHNIKLHSRIDNLNSPVSIKETEFIIKIVSPKKKIL